MTEAHTKQWYLGFFDGIPAEAEIIRMIRPPGTWRNHNSIELFALELVPGNLVILHDERRLVANFSEEMYEIVSERVVVIDDQQSHAAPDHESFSHEKSRLAISRVFFILVEDVDRRCDLRLTVEAPSWRVLYSAFVVEMHVIFEAI